MREAARSAEGYWEDALVQLAAVDPEVQLTLDLLRSTEDVDVFDLRCRSLDNVRIAGWLAVPKAASPDRPYPGLLLTPGYIVDPPVPLDWARRGFVTLCVAHRGKVRADLDVNPGYPGLVTTAIGTPARYIYRGIYADAIRCFDILSQHPAVNPERLGVRGVSQGGALALAVAALRPDVVRAAAIGCPFLTDVERGLALATSGPYEEVKASLESNPQSGQAVLASLEAVDTLRFASKIRARMYLHVGELDRTCPPQTAFALRDVITSEVRLELFENCDHEAGAYWAENTAAAFLSEELGATPLEPQTDKTLHLATIDDVTRESYFDRIAPESRGSSTGRYVRNEMPTSGKFRSWRLTYEAADGAQLRSTLTIPDAPAKGMLVHVPRYGSVNLTPDRSVFESVATFFIEHRGQVGAQGKRWIYPGIFADSIHDADTFSYRDVLADTLEGIEVLSTVDEVKCLAKILVGDDLAIHVAAVRKEFTAIRIDQPLLAGDTWQHRGASSELEWLDSMQLQQASKTLSLWNPADRAHRVIAPVLLCLDGQPTRGNKELLDRLSQSEVYERTHRDAIDTTFIWNWTQAKLDEATSAAALSRT